MTSPPRPRFPLRLHGRRHRGRLRRWRRAVVRERDRDFDVALFVALEDEEG